MTDSTPSLAYRQGFNSFIKFLEHAEAVQFNSVGGERDVVDIATLLGPVVDAATMGAPDYRKGFIDAFAEYMDASAAETPIDSETLAEDARKRRYAPWQPEEMSDEFDRGETSVMPANG
jgi:hypothetical protein